MFTSKIKCHKNKAKLINTGPFLTMSDLDIKILRLEHKELI